MEISDRGILYPILGLATATFIAMMHQVFTGRYPDPISIAHLYLVGLGVGLVAARVGRLGPFGGVLGSPWHETKIEEVLSRETARAHRYGRDLTVVAVKSLGKAKLEIRQSIRSTDQLIGCRNGWNLIILPETDEESANFLMRKICGNRPVLTAQAAFDASCPRQHADIEVLELLHSAKRPEIISIADAKSPETQALAS